MLGNLDSFLDPCYSYFLGIKCELHAIGQRILTGCLIRTLWFAKTDSVGLAGKTLVHTVSVFYCFSKCLNESHIYVSFLGSLCSHDLGSRHNQMGSLAGAARL